jgi:hypothetical protein
MIQEEQQARDAAKQQAKQPSNSARYPNREISPLAQVLLGQRPSRLQRNLCMIPVCSLFAFLHLNWFILVHF